MKAALTTLFIIVAVVVALAMSCPNQASFDRWVAKSSHRQGDPLLTQARDTVLSAQTQFTADYEAHFLWATVEARKGRDTVRYLGVMGMWFEL